MVIANIFGLDDIWVLVIALVVLFGGSQLPKLAKNLGSAGKEFRKAQQEADDEAAAHHAQPAAPAPTAIAPAPAPAPVDDDKITISRNELRQELSNMLDQRQDQPRS